MKYQYNFSFLAQWMEANRGIPKGAIQQAIGARSNNGFKSWMRGEGPMPIISMLRFCNTFQIPVTAFFRDNEADGTEVFRKPDGREQLEPMGGFATDASDRQRGERTLLNPLDVMVIPSVVPGLGNTGETATKESTEPTTVRMQTTAQKVDTVVGNITNDNIQAFVDLEAKHRAQQDKLLEIIAEQQKQIANLTRMLFDKQHGRKYEAPHDDDFPAIAAEPKPNIK